MKSCVLAISLIALADPALAAEAAPAAIPQPAACPAAVSTPTLGGPAPFRRLDRLPKGQLELAVLRTIGGCGVASIKDGGRTYYVPIPGTQRIPLPATVAPRQR